MNLRLLLTLPLALICISCGSDSADKKNAQVFSFDQNDDFKSLIDGISEIEEAISLGQIGQTSADVTKEYLLRGINNVKDGLFILANQSVELTNERKQNALSAFHNGVMNYARYNPLELEEDRLDRLVFNTAKQLRFELARELGSDLQDETWVLFRENFSKASIGPHFSTLSFDGKREINTKSEWVVNLQIDLPKVRAKAREKEAAWLISRGFDLSNVENPGFRYLSSYTVDSLAPEFTMPIALDTIFKTYIIYDYKEDENPFKFDYDFKNDVCKKSEGCRLERVRYAESEIPLGRDFHRDWLPSRSLKDFDYKNKKISFAFLLDTSEITCLFPISCSWTIYDFEITGSGKPGLDPVIYNASFSNETLGKYKNFSNAFPGNQWVAKGGFASIRGGEDKIDSFLVSPKLDINQRIVRPQLVIRESFALNTFDEENLENMEVLISTNFHGGKSTPFDEEVVWTKIERINIEEIPGNSKLKNQTFSFDLKDYVGKEIIVGFRFKSSAGQNYSWGVNSVEIQGLAGELEEIDYLVTDDGGSLAAYRTDDSSISDYTIEKEFENSPEWDKTGKNFVISGYDGNGTPAKPGITRLIFPEVDLSGKQNASVRINQQVFHFKDPLISLEVTKVQVKEAGNPESKWEDIEFSAGTFRDGMPREPELSKWAKLPDSLQGKKVLVALKYESQVDDEGISLNGGTVQWTFNSIEIGAEDI